MKYMHMIVVVIALSLSINGAFSHDDDMSKLGTPGDPNKVTRTIKVGMNDMMRFSPANIAVKRGETIRFVVKNNGKIRHEMVLGTVKDLKDHAALMQRFPEMEHADPNQVAVEPGKTGEMIWQFTRAGKVDFACLQPGHYEAGMAGKVTVANTAVKQPAIIAK